MTETNKSASGLGAGLEISTSRARLAIAQNESAVRTIVCADLPSLYYPAYDLARPATVADWVSTLEIPYLDAGSRHQTMPAKMVFYKIVESVLAKTGEILDRPIDLIFVDAIHKMSERDRARLRSMLKDLGSDAQIMNWDLAVLKSDLDLRREQSILLYNLGRDSIEISWYKASEDTLKPLELEVIDNCGLNLILINLFKSLISKDFKQKLSGRQFHILFRELEDAFSTWNPDETLSIPFSLSLEGLGRDIPADSVKENIWNAMGSSFAVARQILAGTSMFTPCAVITPGPCHPYFISVIQQSLGVEAKIVAYDSVINGLAIGAWESKGMPKVVLPPEESLPVTVQFMPQPEPEVDKNSQAYAPMTEKSFLSERESAKHKFAVDLKQFFSHALSKIETFGLEDIQDILQEMALVFEEFIANIHDQRAKKHIDRHEFGKAYHIYQMCWKKGLGSKYLLGSAVGLCLTQANNAIRIKRFKEAKSWCDKGLKFNPQNTDLLRIKKQLKILSNRK